MRISIVKTDPGYSAYKAKFAHIRLNGEEVKYVVTADEELGMLKRYVRNEDGTVKIAPDGENFLLETVEGKVEITFKGPNDENLRLPKVKVERNADGLIEVLVYSQIKPGAIRRTTLDTQTMDTRRWTERAAAAVCAGAAAEHLCTTLGDVFEPSDCATLAGEEYDRLLRLENTKH